VRRVVADATPMALIWAIVLQVRHSREKIGDGHDS
jgi:hypothetical protein